MYGNYLAVLPLVGIANDEAGNTILVGELAVIIQEGKRGVTTLLWVVGGHQLLESGASTKVILKSDVGWEIRARVQGAGSLAIVTWQEGVLEDPVGAGCWCLKASSGAVAGGIDAILVEEIDLGHNTGDIDAREIADASTIVRWSLEVRELVLGDFALADRPVVVLVLGGEDVDVGVGVVVCVAAAEASERGCQDGGGGQESREDGGG